MERIYSADININFGKEKKHMPMKEAAAFLDDMIDLDDVKVVWNDFQRRFNIFVDMRNSYERENDL